jgi:hypothetical protein
MSEDLSPDLARQIISEASERGVSVEEYLRLIASQRGLRSESQQVSLAELEGFLDDLSIAGLPILPKDFSRADIYRDHD